MAMPPTNKTTLEYLQYATCNYHAIQRSRQCACCFCYKTYSASDVKDYTVDAEMDYINHKFTGRQGRTALCPYCGIDAVVPDFLKKSTMEDLKRWHKQGWGN
jgi:hypothetical protein